MLGGLRQGLKELGWIHMTDDQLRTLQMCTHRPGGVGGNENRAASRMYVVENRKPALNSFDRSIERVHLLLARSEPCSMVGKLTCVGSKRDNLLAGHSSDHRVRHAQTYMTLTTREETMIGT